MMKKKNLLLSILAIISLVVITAAASYAFFTYSKLGTKENTVTTSIITFLYTEVDKVGAGIQIEDAVPLSDEVGKAQTGPGKIFNFKVESTLTGRVAVPYEVTARMKGDSTLDKAAVKLYLTEVNGTNETELLLDNYSNLDFTSVEVPDGTEERILYSGTVYPNGNAYEKNFRLRMWVDENVADFSTGNYNGKTFTITVNVYANANIITQEQADMANNAEIAGISIGNNSASEVVSDDYDYAVTLPEGTSQASLEIETESSETKVEVEKITNDTSDEVAYNIGNIVKLSTKITIDDLTEGDNYYKITTTSLNLTEKTSILKIVVTPNTPVIVASDNILTGNWHTTDTTLAISNVSEESGITYYMDTATDPTTEQTSIEASSNTASTVYYAKACNSDNICSEVASYDLKLDKLTPTAPTITAGDSVASGSWHIADTTLNLSGSSAISGITYYVDTSSNPTTARNSVVITTNTASTTYYAKACNGAGICSSVTNYNLKLDKTAPTTPTITGGSSSWVKSSRTISVSGQSTAVSGIKNYEYYNSTSSSTPASTVTATGTTTSSVTITTEGDRYIYFRAVSNSGLKGSWSSYQRSRYDATSPTVSTSRSRKTTTITLRDTVGVVKYGISTSSSTAPSYTTITSTTSYSTTYTASSSGTYYVWVQDSSGNTTTQSFSVPSSAFDDFSLANQTYSAGASVSWAGLSWYVIADNGTTVDLILRSNYTTGAYGSSTTFSSSTAKTQVNTNFVNANSRVKSAINEGVVAYNSSSGSYVRLPYSSELSSNIRNSSGTLFWTMSSSGSSMYVGSSSGTRATSYTSGGTKYYYSGYGSSASSIRSSGTSSVSSSTLYVSPSSSSASYNYTYSTTSRPTSYSSQTSITSACPADYGCANFSEKCPSTYCGARTGTYYTSTCGTGSFTYYTLQNWYNPNYNVTVIGYSCGSTTIYYASGSCSTFYSISSTSSSIGYRPVLRVYKN